MGSILCCATVIGTHDPMLKTRYVEVTTSLTPLQRWEPLLWKLAQLQFRMRTADDASNAAIINAIETRIRRICNSNAPELVDQRVRLALQEAHDDYPTARAIIEPFCTMYPIWCQDLGVPGGNVNGPIDSPSLR